MNEIAILVPVLGRPDHAQPLADSLKASDADARLVFLCSSLDPAQQDACWQTGETTFCMTWPAGHGDWARKINWAYRHTAEPYLLLGADDIRFHPGWDRAVLEVARETGAGVIGTNDLGNRTVMAGKHSTHPLVWREYADCYGTIDGPGQVVSEAYAHNWVDNELVATAQARGCWAFARDAKVEHLHVFWHKSEDDETYRRGRLHYHADHRLFLQRQREIRKIRTLT
jgi:hypothetical protein